MEGFFSLRWAKCMLKLPLVSGAPEVQFLFCAVGVRAGAQTGTSGNGCSVGGAERSQRQHPGTAPVLQVAAGLTPDTLPNQLLLILPACASSSAESKVVVLMMPPLRFHG